MAQRFYECMFLLDSSRFAQDPQGTEDTVKGYLEKCEAEIVASAPWQEGKLAYEIDGHRKGLHYLVYFKMDGSQVEHLNRQCKLGEVVIRQLVIEHDGVLFELMTQQLASGVPRHEEVAQEEDAVEAEEASA